MKHEPLAALALLVAISFSWAGDVKPPDPGGGLKNREPIDISRIVAPPSGAGFACHFGRFTLEQVDGQRGLRMRGVGILINGQSLNMAVGSNPAIEYTFRTQEPPAADAVLSAFCVHGGAQRPNYAEVEWYVVARD